jgi:lipid II:glycine glycyltransferase (peptidoglycan interpeptide bridge formation enzyme)
MNPFQIFKYSEQKENTTIPIFQKKYKGEISHKPFNFYPYNMDYQKFRLETQGIEEVYTFSISEKENDTTVLQAIVYVYQLPFGLSWLSLPSSPLGDISSRSYEGFMKGLDCIAKKHKSIYARLEPQEERKHNFSEWKISNESYIPRNTIIISLQNSEEEILKNMKEKGRYNIKKGLKKNLKVQTYKKYNKSATNAFYKILQETANANGFHVQDEKYYHRFLETMQNAKLLMVYDEQKEALAGAIILHHEQVATYFYGASNKQGTTLYAPYILQWNAITEAKKDGCLWYDFLGIASPNTKNDPLMGVTQFKTRFSKTQTEWAPAQIYIFKNLFYFFYQLARKIQKLRR